ncbi:MAG: DNA/RNA non-specific endonuclease [Bacteroidales bacterium]
MAKKRRSPKRTFNYQKLLTIGLILLSVGLTLGLLNEQNPHLFKKKNHISEKAQSVISILKDTLAFSKSNQKQTTKEKTAESFDQRISFDLKSYKQLELPAPLSDRSEQIIEHSGYTASYNNKWKVSNWVSYELTREELGGREKRTNKFVADPKIIGARATDADYKGSGYDRGHLAPAADMAWSNAAMKESFYFSNMTPQAPNLNRGIWKSLEDKVRKWAERDSAIIVICGPVLNDTSRTIGKNRVLVPTQFYKIIFSPYTAQPRAIGFLFNNEGSLQTLDSFAVTVDSIEALTGIDFFHDLPDSIESKIEGSFQLNQWF